MKDIQIVNIDYSGVNPVFRKKEQHVLDDISLPWLVPDEGPFYTDKLRLLNGGTLLTYGKDYTFDTPAPDLTERTGRDVYHYILLSDDLIASADKLDLEYQKVGDPIIGRNQLLQMLEDMVIDGNPIDFTTSVIGIPKTFPSAKHSMDVTKPEEVIGFGNLVQLFAILGSRVNGNGKQVMDLLDKLEKEFFQKLDYIQNLQWHAIMNHAVRSVNPHGVKPVDVQLGHLANNKTATAQQEVEGTRSDLFSTPHGFAEIIKEAEPDSEEFVFQNELPLSYYGSGIYLPPPISGSFEGLGGDMENGCFVQEGNGWLVGLQRCFDGRVRNLYYIYDQTLPDDPAQGNWRQSYVQYRHPTIDAADCDANFVISGSGHDVLMIGDNAKNRWWICDPNSSLDPSQHQYKEIDMSEVFQRPDGLGFSWMKGNIFRAGEYFIYVMYSKEGTGVSDNYSGWFYRVKIADVMNPALPNVKFQRVNVTYDTLRRQRLVNQPSFIMDTWDTDANGKYTGGMGMQFTIPANIVLSHRRRQVMTCMNPNDPSIVSFRVCWLVWSNHTYQGGSASVQRHLAADYTLDVRTMTLTLHPEWTYVPWNQVTNVISLTPAQLKRQVLDYIPPNLKINLLQAATMSTISRVPGYGIVMMGSHQDGGAPYVVFKMFENQSRDPTRDYEHSLLPINMPYMNRPYNDGTVYIHPDTPFGFSSYPRWYSDLYYYNGAQQTTPIELFMADKPGVAGMWFYREVEPGNGGKFIARPEVELLNGATPLMREMNNKFGRANIQAGYIGKVNNPKSKDKYSTEYGLVSIRWEKKRNGVPPLISHVILPNGTIARPVQDANGGIIIPFLCDHRLVNGVMQIKAIPTESGYLSPYVWRDWPQRLLGAEFNNVIDMSFDLFFGPKPDGVSGRRPSYAMLTFHTTDRPRDVRQIISKFTWSSSTRINEAMVVTISSEEYPFKSWSTGKVLQPGTDNVLMAAGSDDLQYDPDGSWRFINPMVLGTTNLQVLEAKEHNVNAFSLKGYTGWRLQTTGYSRIFAFQDGWDPGYYTEETIGFSPTTGAFVGYSAYKIANPEHGFCSGENMVSVGGGAMNYTYRPDWTPVLIGATFSIGNWSVFINSDVTVTFNGYSMTAEKRNFDLRDFSEEYRDTVFYIYCVARGSNAEYELTKMLRHNRADSLLICKVTTGNQGITLIERYQPFSISGSPLTAVRQAGIPHTSGGLLEAGSYPHIKRSELYKG